MDNRTAAIFILWFVLIVTFLLLVGAFDYFQASTAIITHNAGA